MECGNKKIKLAIALIIVLLISGIGISLFFLSDSEISFENSNEAFFNRILKRKNQNDIEILSLEAFYKDESYYYYVVYKAYDYELEKISEFVQVYYGKYGGMDDTFNPNNVHPEDEEKAYKPFLDAKKNGVKYTFTKEEIDKYVNEYYENKK